VAAVATQMAGLETLSHCLLCNSERIQAADPEYNLCRCEACGYTFDNPRPTLEALVSFYSKPGKYDSWLAEEAARERLWKRRLKELLPYRTPGNLLDIGTGIGQFLQLAMPYFDQVLGTEVSESAVRVAKEKYKLNISRGTVDELDLAEDSFDNITLFHVLEHVPDPSALIQKCGRLLKGKGTLIIAVPNDVLAWTSLLKKLGKRLGLPAFDKFSPVLGISKAGTSREIHLSHFTPTVLRQLLQAQGFSILAESIDPYYVASGLTLFLHSFYYSLHRVLFSFIGANRYDTIFMIARKRAPI
jgi:ubiquinone/menaquinone biosynthesis C-methylase UbiE